MSFAQAESSSLPSAVPASGPNRSSLCSGPVTGTSQQKWGLTISRTGVLAVHTAPHPPASGGPGLRHQPCSLGRTAGRVSEVVTCTRDVEGARLVFIGSEAAPEGPCGRSVKNREPSQDTGGLPGGLLQEGQASWRVEVYFLDKGLMVPSWLGSAWELLEAWGEEHPGLAYLHPFRSAETNKAKKGQAQSLGQAKPEAGCSPTSPCSRAEGGLWIPLPGVVLAFCPGQEPGPGSAFPQPQGKLLQSEHDPRPQWVPLPPTPALGVWHQGQGPTNHSVLSFTSLLKGPWGVHLGRRPKWPWRLLAGEASSQLPAPSGAQAPGRRGAGLLSLGSGAIAWAQAGLEDSQAEMLVCAAQAGMACWPVSLPTVPGFACQPATLGLAGTSGARGLLGGLLGPAGVFPLDLFATMCMQRGCER